MTVSQYIDSICAQAGWDNSLTGRIVLTSQQTSQVLCMLTLQVDRCGSLSYCFICHCCRIACGVRRLFEDAVTKLNQTSLANFLSELCSASRQQLPSYTRAHLSAGDVAVTSLGNALLLNRLGDVMLRVMRSERPLLQLMKCWSVVSPHLVEV